jgi:hypothetical protein
MKKELQVHPLHKVSTANTTAFRLSSLHGKTLSKRRHPSSSDDIDGSSLTLFTDTLQSLQEMRKLTNVIGDTVVMNEAEAVNKRLISVEERQKCQLNNKRRKLNHKNNNNCKDEYSAVPDNAPSASAASANVESSVVSDEEQRSILKQASRMKRMSVILRNLEGLQGMLIRELQCCTVEQSAAALDHRN